MKIYLAARYSRRLELCGYLEQLIAMGHEVTSHWLDGLHQAIDRTASAEQRCVFATEDSADLERADLCISFTEAPDSPHSRGGRHVEFGMALAMGKRLVVIGHKENVFHCLPMVMFYKTWEEFVSSY